jgi:DMSO/TMAO reductase YedYZ molybdopterin-dependent catalytic subunit
MKTADELLMMNTHRRVLTIACMQGWVMYSPGSNGHKWAEDMVGAGLLTYEGMTTMHGAKIFITPDAMVYRATSAGKEWFAETDL